MEKLKKVMKKKMLVKIRSKAKKYRSTLVMGVFLILNVAESAYFGTPFLTVNEKAESVGEMLCDNICTLGIFFALFMAIYDLIEANAQYQFTIRNAFEKVPYGSNGGQEHE